MRLPVTYVWTHDSIGLGEDGPTHQPIEHLAALRAIPGLDVVRPADANETAAAWHAILEHTDRPAGLALTRQNVPTFPRGTDGFSDTQRRRTAAATCCSTPRADCPTWSWSAPAPRSSSPSPRATCSPSDGIRARVVSMPCREWFDAQEPGLPRRACIPPDRQGAGLRRGRRRAGLARDRRRRTAASSRIEHLRRLGRLRTASTASSASPPRRSPHAARDSIRVATG